jgi:O-antigen ligase
MSSAPLSELSVFTDRASVEGALAPEKPLMMALIGASVFFALLLSTATQFRFGPIGIGELFGGLALVVSLAACFSTINREARSLFLAFFITWLSLILGAFVALATGWADVAPRDLFAIMYAQLLAWVVVAIADKYPGVLTAVLWSILVFPVAQVCMLIVSVFFGRFDVWFGREEVDLDSLLMLRFMGWSVNPNQLGIALASLPFWLLFFFYHDRRWQIRLLGLIALISAVITAILVQSNTVFLAWLSGSVVALGVVYRRYFFSYPAVISLFVLCMAVTSFFFLDEIVSLLNKGEYQDYNGRSPLWVSALEAFAKSPIFGLGPGGHADYGDSNGGYEAHLLLLDFATQGGLVAAGCLIYLFVRSFSAANALGSGLALASVVATGVESLAHNTQRHPAFWIYLVLPIVVIVVQSSNQSSRYKGLDT